MSRVWWASLVLVLCLLGCETGLAYKPIGWQRHGSDEWALTTQGFVFSTSGPYGLVEGQDATIDLQVLNRNAAPMTFDEGSLTTRRGQSFPGHVVPSDALDRRTVSPGQTGSISLLFTFDQPNPRVLGDSFDLVIHYRLGSGAGAERSLVIGFVKE